MSDAAKILEDLECEEWGVPNSEVAELLVEAGYDVLGIDVSPAMIRTCRKRVPMGTFEAASFLDAELPSCRAVTCLGECFNYRFDERNSERALVRLWTQIYRAMEPGGVFVFDLISPGVVPGGSQQMFAEGGDWAVMVRHTEDRTNSTLSRSITTFRREGSVFRRDEEMHPMNLYRPSVVARHLRSIGFSVRHLRGYGECEFRPHHCGFLAQKPTR